jgi:hypothetical protein
MPFTVFGLMLSPSIIVGTLTFGTNLDILSTLGTSRDFTSSWNPSSSREFQ